MERGEKLSFKYAYCFVLGMSQADLLLNADLESPTTVCSNLYLLHVTTFVTTQFDKS